MPIRRRKEKVERREEGARGARIGQKWRSSNDSRRKGGEGWMKWLAERNSRAGPGWAGTGMRRKVTKRKGGGEDGKVEAAVASEPGWMSFRKPALRHDMQISAERPRWRKEQ